MRFVPLLCCVALLSTGCIRRVEKSIADRREIRVAAASNLAKVLDDLDGGFESNTQVHVVASYGSTAQLTQQIEAGAPFDVLLSADTEHVDELIQKGLADPKSKQVYARGQLVVFVPTRTDLHTLADLAKPKPAEIAVAKPELAPYGRAAIEAMQAAGIWSQMESHTKYAGSIAAVMQYAQTGNVDAAFTSLSLVDQAQGKYFTIDSKLYKPIDQTLCVLKSAKDKDAAELYASFLDSLEARTKFKKYGYTRQ